MTTIFTTVLETISDCALLIAIIYTVNALYEDSYDLLIKNKNRVIIAIAVSCVFSIIFNQSFFNQLLLLKWLLLFVNFSKYFLLTAFVFKNLSIKSVIISFIIQFICSNITSGLFVIFTSNELKKTYFFNIILHLIIRIIILIVVIYINKNEKYANVKNILSIVPNYIFIFILLSLILSDGLIQTANFNTSNIGMKIQVLKILSSTITICTTIIILSLLFNVVSKKYQSDINTALEKQIETQLYHYEQLEKMNAELRRFRHDYINHMKCVGSMALNRECDNILNYLDKLSASFPKSSFLFETGNYIADAVLTEKQINSPDNISIEFDGVVSTDIDNVDLCIILSNALDNAVEACCLCDGDKIITVYSGFKHGYFVFKIKNPTVNTNVNGRITTTKSDKMNHGFGLANIKRTLKKYDGRLSTSCEDNIFTLNITFSDTSAL